MAAAAATAPAPTVPAAADVAPPAFAWYSTNGDSPYLPKVILIKTGGNAFPAAHVSQVMAAQMLKAGIGIDMAGGAVIPSKDSVMTIKIHHATGHLPDGKSSLTYTRCAGTVATQKDWEAGVEPPSFVKEVVKLLLEASTNAARMALLMAGASSDVERAMFIRIGAVPEDITRRVVVTQLTHATDLMMMSLAAQENALAILSLKTTPPLSQEKPAPNPATMGAAFVAAAAAASP